MVAIRLTKMGSKKKPYYRIVAVDHEKPRESAFIELLGHYNPLTKPADVQIDMEKYNAWVAKGAKPSETVRSLVKKLHSNN
jgi:small subunit ribosomal protein S16